jgi:hypothetical protein
VCGGGGGGAPTDVKRCVHTVPIPPCSHRAHSEHDKTVPTLLPVFLTADRRHDQKPKIVGRVDTAEFTSVSPVRERECESTSTENGKRTHVKGQTPHSQVDYSFPIPILSLPSFLFEQRPTPNPSTTNPSDEPRERVVVARLNGRSPRAQFCEYFEPGFARMFTPRPTAPQALPDGLRIQACMVFARKNESLSLNSAGTTSLPPLRCLVVFRARNSKYVRMQNKKGHAFLCFYSSDLLYVLT